MLLVIIVSWSLFTFGRVIKLLVIHYFLILIILLVLVLISVHVQQAIVFIVGGGNYIEYQNLVDYSKVSVLIFLHNFIKMVYSCRIVGTCVYLKYCFGFLLK